MAFKDSTVELEERVVAINRVTKVVKVDVVFALQLLQLLVTVTDVLVLVQVKAQEVPKQSVKQKMLRKT